MKKTTICKFIDYVHISDVDLVDKFNVQLKSGKSFTNLPAKYEIKYHRTTDTPEAGTILKETIRIVTDSKEAEKLITPYQYYIIRLNRDDDFIVGTSDYPAIKKIESIDGNKTTLIFTRKSPL